MQTIFTKYVGASNFRGSRIIATASGNNVRAIVSYDSALSSEDAHKEGVLALCKKLNWHGELIGSDWKHGMVWVFTAGLNPRVTA